MSANNLSVRERFAVGGPSLVVGHRGAMGYRPENTFASYEHALELGADWIECDVHLSQDGVLTVIHDETLDRTTNGKGFVKDHTFAQLRELDAGGWFAPEYAGQRIPSLPELLDWATQRGTCVDVEIKNGPLYYFEIAEKVVEAIQQTGMVDQTIVISFDHAVVQRVKQLNGAITTGVLYAGKPLDPALLAKQAQADAVLPHWAYVTKDDVAACHAQGIAVAPWATSDPVILAMLIQSGVDGIGTNHPDVMRRVLDEVSGAA